MAGAEAAFRRAIDLQQITSLPTTTWHRPRGTNRPLEAEAAYRDALRLQPNFVEAHNNLASFS